MQPLQSFIPFIPCYIDYCVHKLLQSACTIFKQNYKFRFYFEIAKDKIFFMK